LTIEVLPLLDPTASLWQKKNLNALGEQAKLMLSKTRVGYPSEGVT